MRNYYPGQNSSSTNFKQFNSVQSDKIAFGFAKIVSSDEHTKETILKEDDRSGNIKFPEFMPYEVISFNNSLHAFGKIIKNLLIALLPISLFILFFDEIKYGLSASSLQINSFGLTMTAFYLLLFSLGVLFTTKKRKMNLSIDDNYLHLKSFPSFYQKVPIQAVAVCRVNAFSRDRHSSFDYLSAQFNTKTRKYSVDLEAGVELILNNGRRIMIGLTRINK